MLLIEPEFERFKLDLAKRESGDNYQCVNKFGFLGRYQFGKPRLFDLGVSIDGWRPRYLSIVPQDIRQISKGEFLINKELQDACFRRHVELLGSYIIFHYSDEIIKKYSISGMVAGAHLKGIGGLKQYILGNDNVDALGTSVSDYVQQFAGYNIFIK